MTNVPRISFIDFVFDSSVVFWVGNEELPHLYAKRLGDPKRLGETGYLSHKFGRTNNLSDGTLLTALPKDYFRVVNSRVLQLLHVESDPPYSQYDMPINKQVYKILQYVLILSEGSLSRSNAYSTLRGFVLSNVTAHRYTNFDAHKVTVFLLQNTFGYAVDFCVVLNW
ncbi:LOW QUALITY PROTEIN: hypothetical protein HID58_043569 [Brassica napus]|uniref:Uncharacterized protein n=1 Tax=Brassica napus TaxID=3708 RepID=A0ABQ8BGW0_BRANA|nr:LOW QUALITY PROTEIN: hypothetical protein HID58_043569 [Brassica napus]